MFWGAKISKAVLSQNPETMIPQKIINSNLEDKETQGFHDNLPSIEVVRLPKRVGV